MMALINCPKCGEQISEKAEVCPHCKERLAKQEEIICEECQTKYSADMRACPQCGHPTPSRNKKQAKKKSRKTLAIILLIIILAGGFFVYQQYQDVTYYNNMAEITNTMLDGAAKAEDAGNTIMLVWTNAIYQKRADQTDKYTMANGRFVDDFNDALDNLFDDEEFGQSIAEIQENQAEVIDLMKKLKNPPSQYAEAFGVLNEYYENYMKMTNSVINLSGSLNSFSEDFGASYEAVVNSHQKMLLYFD